LAGEFATKHIILHTLDHQQHIAVNAFLLLEGHVRPSHGIDVFLNTLLQGVEYLFVGALHLIRVDAYAAFQLLRLQCNCTRREGYDE
jgi:hypothetical protein